jgi:hypothetical protein
MERMNKTIKKLIENTGFMVCHSCEGEGEVGYFCGHDTTATCDVCVGKGVIRTNGGHMTDLDKLDDQVAQPELEDLRTAAARYEEVRKWTPDLFSDVWKHCMTSSHKFDDMVDIMRLSR